MTVRVLFNKLRGYRCTEHKIDPKKEHRVDPPCVNCGEPFIQGYLLSKGWFWVDGKWFEPRRRKKNVPNLNDTLAMKFPRQVIPESDKVWLKDEKGKGEYWYDRVEDQAVKEFMRDCAESSRKRLARFL